MCSSGPGLQNIILNNVAVNGGGSAFGAQRRDTDVEKEWQGLMDDAGVVLLIQALVNAKIANKLVVNTYSHYDFAPNI